MVEFGIDGQVTLAGVFIAGLGRTVPFGAATINGVVYPVLALPSGQSISATISGTVPISGTVNVQGTLLATILGTVLVAGTVGIAGSVQAIVAGGTIVREPVSYNFSGVTGVIKATPGILYGINASGPSGLVSEGGTVVVYDSTGTITVIPVPAGGYVTAPFGPGVNFNALTATILGGVDVTTIFK